MTSQTSGDDYATVAATDIRALEHGLDDTLGRASQLLLTLASGRTTSGLGVAAGQSGAEEIGNAINCLIAARGHIAGAHRKFERDARAAGFQWRMAGPLETKPDTPIVEQPRGRHDERATA